MSTDYRKFVDHPRYGRYPQITGLNPADDPRTGRIQLHWHSPPGVRIADTAIAADLSRQAPATIPVTHYFDVRRSCVDCGRPFIFFAAEQQYWYEALGFPLDADCVRCVPCRKTQRGLEFHRTRYEELFQLQSRSSDQDLDLADSALCLVEHGWFGTRVLDRVRAVLKNAETDDRCQSLRHRVQALEGDSS